MSWTAHDIPDQTGRVAVVTGANAGIRLEVARELARKGADVVMACRDTAKAEAARGSILKEIPARLSRCARSISPRSRRCAPPPKGWSPRIPRSTCSSTTPE